MTENTLEFLQNFFARLAELSINDQMMEYSYAFPSQRMKEYVDQVCSIPFEEYIEYLRSHPLFTDITAEDVTQISSVTDCEIGFCTALQGVRRPLTSEDVGVLLQNDGVVRNSGANLKYGENHAKAAFQLGLSQERYGYWYLSCLGRIFPDLTLEKQKALLCRTLLRNRLYAAIFVELDSHDVSVAKIWATARLSESTQLRRRSSVRHFIQLIAFQASREGYQFVHQLDFTIGDKTDPVRLIPTSQYSNAQETSNSTLFGTNYQPNRPLDYYLDCLSMLHVNRHGDEVAPHKYILMMSILNLITKGLITTNNIIPDDLLDATFNAEWTKYVRKDSSFIPQMKMPFSHMGSEPFWIDNNDSGTIDLALFYYLSQPESSEIIRTHLEKLLNNLNYVDSGTLVLERNLEFTFFTEGFTILKKYHNIWRSFLNLVPDRGENKCIYIRIDDDEYEVELDNIYQQGSSSELLQVRYRKTDTIAIKMRTLFADVYDYSVKQREMQRDGKKKPIQLPEELNVKVFLHSTDIPAHFVFSYQRGEAATRDVTYYKNKFLQMANLVNNGELAAKMMIMLWSTMEYLVKFPGYREIENRLPILAIWEGIFLKKYNMYFETKRDTTAFSTPFIYLSQTTFWRLLDENDNIIDRAEARAIMTFVRLSDVYSAVEIDKELVEYFLSKDTREEFEKFFQRNIKLLLV